MELGCTSLQFATSANVSKYLEIVAECTERLAKRAKVDRDGEVAAVATSMAWYVSFLPERDEHKSRCKELILENQCIPSLVAEAKELGAKEAELEKTVTSAKSTPANSSDKKGANVAYKHVVAL